MHAKRWIALALVCLLLPAGFALAAPGTTAYRLEEARLTVEIPDELLVLTRTMTDEALSAIGLARETHETIFALPLLLDALDLSEENLLELSVSLTALANPELAAQFETLRDYNRIPADTLVAEFTGQLKSGNTDELTAGLALPAGADEITLSSEDVSVYQHAQARFVRMSFIRQDAGGTAYGCEYNTVYDSEQVSVSIARYHEPLRDADYALIRQVVDSIVFDGAPDASPMQGGTRARSTLQPLLLGAAVAVLAAGMAMYRASKRRKDRMQVKGNPFETPQTPPTDDSGQPGA